MLRTFAIVASLLAAGIQPAAAEVIAKTETGFVSRNAVEVKADPAESWKALIAPNLWWSGEHTYSGVAANMYLDAQATGCFCEKLPAARDAAPGARGGSIEHMRVIYAAPGKVLRMAGGLGPLQSEAVGGILTITLKPTVSGTRILWEYVVGGYMRYKTDEIAPLVDKVMNEQVARLAKHLGPAEAGEADPITAEPAKP